MRYSISDTAEYGDYKTGDRLVQRKPREMRRSSRIQSGELHRTD